MVVINSALYICFGLAGSLVNVPLLIFVVIKSNLRNKYPTIAGMLMVDFICVCCLITSGFLFLFKKTCREPYLIASVVLILQSVFTLCTVVDYLVARFKPIFFRSSKIWYRILSSITAFVIFIVILIILIRFEHFSCSTSVDDRLDGFVVLYSICIGLNSSSLIALAVLFHHLADLKFKFAIIIRFTVILSLIVVPSAILFTLFFTGNRHFIHIGIDISVYLVAISIIVNSLLQIRNETIRKEAKEAITRVVSIISG